MNNDVCNGIKKLGTWQATSNINRKEVASNNGLHKTIKYIVQKNSKES